MTKRIFLFYALCILSFNTIKAQQYGLFNTQTLFDAFENPAVKSFTLDSSRKFASNFFLPNFSINATNTGSSSSVIRKAVNTGILDTRSLTLGTSELNKINQNSNIYIATLKIFSSYKYNQEVGLAWQVRSDATINYTNETLTILDSYKRFNGNPISNAFNNDGYEQSYHQFSISVRENFNQRLAFGVKMSLLSGIAYNSLKINQSYLYADGDNDQLVVGIRGTYRGNFLYDDEIERKLLYPTFKNPGASISLGTTYQSRSGVFIMANVKDLGFIKWNNQSHSIGFNTTKYITDLSTKSSNDVVEEITDIVKNADSQSGFITPTNAKADFLISKTFGLYTPNLIISKNLFYNGGDVAFVNRFNYKNLSASVTPAYNFNNYLMIGLQGMYRTPNFEFFLGTDNLVKTYYLANGIYKNSATVGTGYNGASIYMGLGIKFGQVVNHPSNFSTMPGVNGEKVYKGIFRSMFNFFKKN